MAISDANKKRLNQIDARTKDIGLGTIIQALQNGDTANGGLGTDTVDDTHIDWGTGANQVSAGDMPIADAGGIITGTTVEAALAENRTALDTAEASIVNLLARANDSILFTIPLAGTMGADTGVGGCVFGNPAATNPGAATLLPVVAQFDTGEVAGSKCTNYTTEAAEATDDDVICFPASPANGDAFLLGAAQKFHAVLIGISTQANMSLTTTWEYTDTTDDDTSWTAIPATTMLDNTTAMQVAGTGNKLLVFQPPADWATVTMDTGAVLSGAKYYIRCVVSAFSSSTTEPLVDQVWFYFGDQFTGIQAPVTGNIDAVYFNWNTLSAANADSKFLIWNVTQDTFQVYTCTKATALVRATGTLAITENDQLVVIQCAEDGSTEFADGSISLEITPTAIS